MILTVLAGLAMMANPVSTLWMWAWLVGTWGGGGQFSKPSAHASGFQVRLWNFCVETRMFMLGAMPFEIIKDVMSYHSPFVKVIYLLCDCFWVWAAYKCTDDRWKKRRAKLLSKVTEVSGKLVVVPVSAGTR